MQSLRNGAENECGLSCVVWLLVVPSTESKLSLITSCPRLKGFEHLMLIYCSPNVQPFNFCITWNIQFIRSPYFVDLFESMIVQVWILSCCQNHYMQLLQKRRMMILRGFCLRINTSRPMRPAATVYQFMSRLPLWEAGLLKHMEFSPDPFTLSINLSHGIQEVSNGSVWPDNQNSFGWLDLSYGSRRPISTGNGTSTKLRNMKW